MKVLIIGSGGREHALAWKAAQSPRLKKLWIAPGNGGTGQVGENVSLPIDDHAQVTAWAVEHKIDLILVGPEAPLAAGLVDACQRVGLRAFGPTQAAARIEASKAFAKDFMARYHIPTARFAVFSDFESARAHLRQVDYPVVVKASGLAAGKGVLIPNSLPEAEAALHSLLVDREFGEASREVIIEERLEGPEVSLLAFCDGRTLRTMPPAQDHKRLLDGDQGPNTGGMGAYAPTPFWTPELNELAVRTILQPTVDGLRAEGCPFVGVLYAGLMLTAQGPLVLEFNCRFGDPETEAILPLLASDLLEVAQACVDRRLESVEVRWSDQTAACVVLASENYPAKVPSGRKIRGLEANLHTAQVFHAGTALHGGQMVTAGGRVLAVTGLGDDLPSALQAAYRRVETIHFEGMQYRTDIGAKVLSAYGAAGVNIDAGNRAVELMKEDVRSTYGSEVLAGIGAFGGLFDAGRLKDMQNPVLVASTDGVGTKVKLAAQAGRYASIGQDIVNHCINDILVQGARPLFFLDYFAASKLNPQVTAEIVGGMAAACREAGCALLGGETAEMPGVYAPGEFDVAGTIVGVVEKERILPRPDIQAGDVLLGLQSSGAHTNGYSLIRKVFAETSLEHVYPELGQSLGEALLAPHRAYLNLLWGILQNPGQPVKALVHLTGGGFIENIPRILPQGLGAVVRLGSWPIPALFRLIERQGRIPAAEMYRVFNMGIGMVVVAAPQTVEGIQSRLGEQSWVIGEVRADVRGVKLV